MLSPLRDLVRGTVPMMYCSGFKKSATPTATEPAGLETYREGIFVA